MKKQHVYLFSLSLLLGFWMCFGVLGGLGCGEKKEEPECSSNLDCEANHSCVKGKCVKRGEEGDSCTDNGPGCADDLLCDRGTCKVACQTYFDCESGEDCNTNTGICEPKGDSGGPDLNVDEGPGQQVGEECDPQKCASGLDCVKWTDNASRCWKGCKADSDCGEGLWCAGSYCVKGGEKCQYEKPGGKLVIPCYKGLECVLSDSIVEGKCLRPCNGNDCPSGLSCVEKNNKKHCQAAGDKAGAGEPCGEIGGKTVDCVTGYSCVEKSSGSTDKVCTKQCAKDADCKWPSFCNSQLCLPGDVGDAGLGADCSPGLQAPQAEKCSAGLFCLVVKQDDKKGKCYRDCTDPRADACPSETSCSAIANDRKLCLKACSKPEDCPQNAPNCSQTQGGAQVCLHKSP